MAKRVIKASLPASKDRSGAIQVFLQQAALGASLRGVQGWDVGDVLVRKGRSSNPDRRCSRSKVERLRLLVKVAAPAARQDGTASADVEQRTAHRSYVDLIVSDESREVFRKRTRIVQYLRSFLEALDFNGSSSADDAR